VPFRRIEIPAKPGIGPLSVARWVINRSIPSGRAEAYRPQPPAPVRARSRSAHLDGPVQHHISHEWLYAQYILENRTPDDLAAELGARPSSVARWAKSYGIPIRSRGGPSRKSALATKGA